MPNFLLVLNAGSSTLKFALFEPGVVEPRVTGLCDAKTRRATIEFESGNRIALDLPDNASVPWLLKQLVNGGALPDTPGHNVLAVGHRVVHGGAVFHESVRIDANVKKTLGELSALAPLHNPPALAAIEAAEAALPGVPHVAVFDTAFFAKLPPQAFIYPLPYEWYTDWGVRRFGFHGISHAYCANRATEMLGRNPASLRIIICHLGNGCSASAVRGGAAVATSMGFTPLEGLMMGTRSGSVDPSILIDVQRNHGLSADALDHALNHASGLLGVSGVSSDLREVDKAADAGNERARLALAIFADRVRQTVGAYAATTGGVDALVFTAGIGEHSARMRAAACEGLSCLGLNLDAAQNASCRADADIATANSPGRILVLHTREEWLIGRETLRILGGASAS
jgi:acetate kinase